MADDADFLPGDGPSSGISVSDAPGPRRGPALADGVESAAGEIAFNRPSRRLATRLSDAGARVWT